MISVTVGWQEAPESSFGRDVEPGYWNFLSEKAKKMFPNVLVAFGNRLPDPAMANDCVRDEVFDYWEVCRPLLADPEMIHKAAEDRMEEVRPCIGSLNCLSRLFRDLPYTCTMNPMLGHEVEPEYHVTEATEKKRVMVIGAGPAGMEAAITARRRGHSVTVFDKADKIGGNLAAYAANDLARPADLQSVIDYYGVMAKKLGVEVRLNTEANAKFMRSVLHEYDACIVAAGARTDLESFRYMPGSELLIDALEVAHRRKTVGKRVVMVGGGAIGLTISEFLQKAGHEVTVVEKEKRIGGDIMPTFKWRHTAWVDELGIKTVCLAQLVKVTAEGATVRNGKGEEIFIPCDNVIVSSPRRANHDLFYEFQWMVDELHGGGDATVPRGLDAAIQEGYKLGVRI
jgi:2,4-dienoyl-CoA reductase (NADPH2)